MTRVPACKLNSHLHAISVPSDAPCYPVATYVPLITYQRAAKILFIYFNGLLAVCSRRWVLSNRKANGRARKG